MVLAAHDRYILDCPRLLIFFFSEVVEGTIPIGPEVEFCHDGLDGYMFSIEVHEQVSDCIGSFFSEPGFSGDELEALFHELTCCKMLIFLHFLTVTRS